jgi:uncharacterized damage-inducible protein DinB
MTRLHLVQAQTDRVLGRLLGVFDRAVASIPAEQIAFRPTPVSMSAREMAHHVYQILLITAVGVSRGSCSRDDAESVTLDPDRVTHPDQLAGFAGRVRGVAEPALASLTDEMLDRRIEYWFGLQATGLESLRNLNEEVLHHRGQMQVYLRLMGVEPPRL